MTRLKPIVLAIASSVLSSTATADLMPLDDGYLSDVTGQAFITIDNYKVMQQYAERSKPEYNGQLVETEFYRINMGAKMEAIASADELVLGKFDRYENGAPCPASGCDLTQLDRHGNPLKQERLDADVSISNFALGEYVRHDDGTVEAKPMKVENPFYEIAFENRPDGTREVIGARLGFGKAGGMLSGDMNSMTGHIDVLIKGKEKIYLQDLIGLPGSITVDVTANAYLQYPEHKDEYDAAEYEADRQPQPDKENPDVMNPPRIPHDYTPNGPSGDYDPIRADTLGILDGYPLEAKALGIPITIQPENCRTSTGTDTCQPIDKFGSLELGKASPDGMVKNFFLSMQSRDLAWAIDPNGNLDQGNLVQEIRTGNVYQTNPDNANFTQTFLGGFINIPAGGLELTPHETVTGLPRHATRYTDAALGLFGQTPPDTGGGH